MDYRPLTEQDAAACVALEGYAFGYTPDPAHFDAARLARYRGLFAGPTPLAQLELLPLSMQTGHGVATAAGVAAVASDPASRRRGHVNTLMRRAMDELRAAGVPFCVLFPFKRSFYGRMGWATMFERRVYSGPPARFAAFKPGPGSFVPAGAAELAELDAVYSAALRGRFGPLVRDQAWWRDKIFRTWDGKPNQVFLWRDEQGQPRAYLVFRIEGQGRDATLRCKELAALDPVARGQLFAFLAGHQDQVETVRFAAPADAPVNLLLADPLDCTVEPYFMLRILDVAAALQAYAFPRDLAGQLVLQVRDSWLDANQGVYSAEFAGGVCQVSRLAAEGLGLSPAEGLGLSPADLSCDVATLAQLISRLVRPRSAAAFGLLDVQSRPALDLLDRAFAGLAPTGFDFF